MTFSIIVPTYNEADTISDLIPYLKTHAPTDTELIVVDGGSTDQTLQNARRAGASCFASSRKGRATQMNLGATKATGEIFYFVHADSIPPPDFTSDITQAIRKNYQAGCYRFKFNSSHPLLKINAFCTRFDRIMCRGGDQTLFITRELFEELGGYRDEYVIMEDYDLIQRIQKRVPFKIIPKEVIVSARKYEKNNYLKVQLANFIIFMMYFWGCSQQKLLNTYKRLLSVPKS